MQGGAPKLFWAGGCQAVGFVWVLLWDKMSMIHPRLFSLSFGGCGSGCPTPGL